MKNLLKHFNFCMFVALFFVTSISCDDQNVELKSPEIESGEISEILLMEQQTGISFFKKEITLTDESGNNEVTMRIASKDEDILNDYLEYSEIKIKPIYGKIPEKDPPFDKSDHALKEITPSSNSSINTEGIFSEVIDSKFAPGVIGYSVHITRKDKNAYNGRILANGYPYQSTYYSGKWDERFQITAYNSVTYKIEAKNRWYTGWSTRTYCSIYYPNPCDDYWVDFYGSDELAIDGPYQHRLVIDFNNESDFIWDFYDL